MGDSRAAPPFSKEMVFARKPRIQKSEKTKPHQSSPSFECPQGQQTSAELDLDDPRGSLLTQEIDSMILLWDTNPASTCNNKGKNKNSHWAVCGCKTLLQIQGSVWAGRCTQSSLQHCSYDIRGFKEQEKCSRTSWKRRMRAWMAGESQTPGKTFQDHWIHVFVTECRLQGRPLQPLPKPGHPFPWGNPSAEGSRTTFSQVSCSMINLSQFFKFFFRQLTCCSSGTNVP